MTKHDQHEPQPAGEIGRPPGHEELLDTLERLSVDYFLERAGDRTGLIADSTWEDGRASIAATGFALPVFAVAATRGWLSRRDAVERVLAALRFLAHAHQGPEPDATGYHGFFYHFLRLDSGRRDGDCEISTIDTACLLAGALAATMLFDQNVAGEREIRQLADTLYRRADWRWARNAKKRISHGWRPEDGFIPHDWHGYDEALFLYVLALGAPDAPLDPDSYAAWLATYEWRTLFGQRLIHSAPLFTHQFPQLFLDLRGLEDAALRGSGIDYFENTRRATYAQRAYAAENPGGFRGYGPDSWGITASAGPGPERHVVDGRPREFLGYRARGVPEPDDGTLSPWVVSASLPFAPEIVLPALAHFWSIDRLRGRYGLTCSMNQTFPAPGGGWCSEHFYGINEGPIVLMIENYRSGLIWRCLRRCPYIGAGLRRAGFRGGWLGAREA